MYITESEFDYAVGAVPTHEMSRRGIWWLVLSCLAALWTAVVAVGIIIPVVGYVVIGIVAVLAVAGILFAMYSSFMRVLRG